MFSLGPRVDDEGATFASTYDGSPHHLTPEEASTTQVLLGSDIQMVLDVCPPLPSPPGTIRSAVERTALWAGAARKTFLAHERPDLSQFGIVQGASTPGSVRAAHGGHRLRGYAVGGLSVGSAPLRDAPSSGGRPGGLPEDVPATSWGWAIRWGSSTWWGSASTCSTASCPPAWGVTARC